MARLLVLYGPGGALEGVTRAVGSAGLEVRRTGGDDHSLELDHAEVSRVHLRVDRVSTADAAYEVRDLGSHNGTVVNGRRVDAAVLASGDILRVGPFVLLFEVLDATALQGLPLKRQQDEPLVGDSHGISGVRERIRRTAPTNVPVLVLGESGVGKELVAAELHRHSGRSGPLVPVNCAALTASVAESELFGHVKGAFTGATEASDGLFGRAARGTIFLDEIGEMTLDMQAKLLRTLATGEIRPVGAAVTQTIDIRVVAATNVALRNAVDAGYFRGDLYSRLLGATIEVPPLRTRRDDILPLIRHFLGDAEVEITPDAAEALLIHRWEFNVRELSQLIATAEDDARARRVLDVDVLPPHIAKPVLERVSVDTRGSVEAPIWMRIRRSGTPTAEELHEVVAHYRGNIHHIAEFFGKDRRQVYRWIERHAIDVDRFRESDP